MQSHLFSPRGRARKERAEHDARAGIVLQHDDRQRQTNDQTDLHQVARTRNREVVFAHHAGEGESRGDLDELHGLHAERAELEPRFGAVDLLARHERRCEQQQSRDVGRIGEHMIEPVVEQQHHDRRNERDAHPDELFHVEMRERKEVGRPFLVRSRNDRNAPRQYDEHIEQDRRAVHAVENPVVSATCHTRDNRCSCSSPVRPVRVCGRCP